MLRGTRIIEGTEAEDFNMIINILKSTCRMEGFEEIIVPSIWEQKTFTDKVGSENSNMMWNFQDKKGREVCLIPEVTGIIQEEWRENWKWNFDERKIFYVNRCYRYERPQKGRYREFTQFGVEWLGANSEEKTQALKNLLTLCLNDVRWMGDFWFEMKHGVKRGLSYYKSDGFEVEAPNLGAQKQIAGGGEYEEGAGWAIGVDRVLLATQGEFQLW